jgi:hypothetical protein
VMIWRRRSAAVRQKSSAMLSERRTSTRLGPSPPPSPLDAPARSAMASATVEPRPGEA